MDPGQLRDMPEGPVSNGFPKPVVQVALGAVNCAWLVVHPAPRSQMHPPKGRPWIQDYG